MSILRRHVSRDFTVITNRILEDSRLTFRARGVLAFLLSKPDGWTVRAETIAAGTSEGRDAIRTALRELRAVGYYRLTKERRRTGHLVTVTSVYDEAQPWVAAEYAALVESGAGRDAVPKEAGEPGGSGIDVTGGGKAGLGTTGSGKPGAGKPGSGSPGSGFPGTFVRTENKNSEKDIPPGGRRPPAVSRGARKGSRTAATRTGNVRAKDVRDVIAAIPAPLRARLPDPLPSDLVETIRDQLEQRTPEQMIQRVNRRWRVFGYALAEEERPGAIRRPVGVALTLVGQRCPDPRCEDGQNVDKDAPCARCRERREDHVAAQDAGSASSVPPGELDGWPRAVVVPVAEWPLCSECGRPMPGSSGPCRECREGRDEHLDKVV